ncbi:MAG: beta-lactamase family protein [Pirellulaceae bacterium]|nr:beta-lactamase family protein [Pirellulaceae bacterium]
MARQRKAGSGGRRTTRRTFLAAATVVAVAGSWPRNLARAETAYTPAGMAVFDDLMERFMEEHRPPGASLAVTHKGRLVHARGYGMANVEEKEPVEPTSLFRIASLSKPFTSAAVLRLKQQGKLTLDDRVFEVLGLASYLEEHPSTDARLRDVRIRHCLQHTGGWDRGKSIDPMGARAAFRIARELGVELPIETKHIIRFMLDQPLDTEPGTAYAYSNFGYCLLGRVIEAYSGKSYGQFVDEEVLKPIGIRHMRLGKNLFEDRAPGEVTYYDSGGRTGRAVSGPNIGEPAPLPYGVEMLETMDANGGWIASAVDLVRFASALDDPKRCKLLDEATMLAMLAPPEGPVGHVPDGSPRPSYYGCGWSVQPSRRARGRYTKSHFGMLAGSSTVLTCRADGTNWAALFNSDADGEGRQFAGLIDSLLRQTTRQIREWPKGDLFETYGGE